MEFGNDMMYESIEKNQEAAVQMNSGSRKIPPQQKKQSSGKIMFPLITNDDKLEKLLAGMIGEDEAKKVQTCQTWGKTNGKRNKGRGAGWGAGEEPETNRPADFLKAHSKVTA